MGRAHEQAQRVSLAYVMGFLVVNADGHRYGISCHLQSDFSLVNDMNGQGTCTGTGLAYVLLFLVADENGQQGTGTALQDHNSFLALRSGFPVVDANGQGTRTGTELA